MDAARAPEDDSVSLVLNLVGDRWSILLIREAFFGVSRFSDFARNLGMTNRNLLTARLRHLVDVDIFERRDEGAGRIDYKLTPRGRDLYQVLMAMLAWGDRHLAGSAGPALTMRHQTCGKEFTPVTVCDQCGEALEPRDVDYEPQVSRSGGN